MFLEWLLRVLFGKSPKAGYSIRGFWGEIKHYNKNNVQTGYTIKGFWGERRRYDMNGNLKSVSVKNFWGGYNTYDAEGNLIRRSHKNFGGGYSTFDKSGKKVQESYHDFWGGFAHYDMEKPAPVQTKHVEKKPVQPLRDVQKPIAAARRYEKPDVKEKQTLPVPDTGKLYAESKMRTDSIRKQKGDAHYYAGISESGKDGEDKQYIRLLVFRYQQFTEFPAIAYLEGNKIIVEPLQLGVGTFDFPVSEIGKAKEEKVADMDMEVMDDEFLACMEAGVGKEFEDLLPEYSFDATGISRSQYVLECGMVLTEKSMDALRGCIVNN